MNSFFKLVMVICCSAPFSVSAQSSCSALLQHGLADITKSFSSSHTTVTNYQRHCGTIDESTSNRTVADAGFELFGVFGGTGDADVARTRRRIENWCNINRDFAEQNSGLFEEVRHINTAAVQAFESCQQFNRRDIDISVQRNDDIARNVTITIDSSSDGKYDFLGMVSNGYSCEYFVATNADSERNPEKLENTTRINIPIKNDNIHIVCTREAPSTPINDSVGEITYEHGSIQILTSGPALQLEFPQIVDTYYTTPPGTILPILGEECPAGWTTFDEAEGRFLVGSSEQFGLGTPGGTATIPSDGSHRHSGTTGFHNRGIGHSIGFETRGDNVHRHTHNFNTNSTGSHDHGGSNVPPYFAVHFCKR